jgi:hypothetical protein
LVLLIPREHGAYGQLLLPLAVALVIGGATAGGLALGTAAACAFLAHEPLLVLLGQRGGRASRELRSAARRSLLLFGTVAIVAGCVAVAILPTRARFALLVPVAFAFVAASMVASGRERTTSGEVIVAMTLTSISFPVVVAGGIGVQAAAAVVAVFAAAFVSATVAVRAVIAHATRSPHGPGRGLAATIVMLLIFALIATAAFGVVAPVAIWAVAPACAFALVLLATTPSPRHLRRIGWTLVGTTAAAAVVLIVALR